MKRSMQNLIDMLDAAFLEEGVDIVSPNRLPRTGAEPLEENRIEIVFSEAADYDDIHTSILGEHWSEKDISRPGDCQYGPNEMCFVAMP
jgi:hypothetical protein